MSGHTHALFSRDPFDRHRFICCGHKKAIVEALDSTGQRSRNVFQYKRHWEYLKCVYPIHLFVNHRRRLDLNVCVGFLLEARGGFRGGCPQVIFSLHLFLRTIYQVCVCVRVGGRCTGAGVLLLLGCQGGPDLPQPAVNPQMWRVGGFDCYSISGRPPRALLYGDVRQKLGEKALGPRE